MAAGLVPKNIFEQYYDPDVVVDLYFRIDSPFAQDAVVQETEELQRAFTTCGVKGDLLIGIYTNPTVHPYFVACKYFKEIIATTYSQNCLQHLEKWLKNDPGAYDYSPIFKYMCKLEDDSNKWMENQETLRRKIKYTVEHDVCKSDPLAPHVFPQADCLLIQNCLELICMDEDTYCKALKNTSSLLRIGGHLIMSSALECTFHILKTFKFPVLCINEGFLRKAISDAGFVIKLLEVKPRIEKSLYSIIDATARYFLVACKEREVI